MSSDIDNLLSSVGISNSSESNLRRPVITPKRSEVQEEQEAETNEVETTVLTNDDYCEILENAGVLYNIENNAEQGESLELESEIDTEPHFNSDYIVTVGDSVSVQNHNYTENISSTESYNTPAHVFQENQVVIEHQSQPETVIADSTDTETHNEETETGDTMLEEQQRAIPLNSPTLLINDTTARFSGAEWFDKIQKSRIILAGLGGIGSWTALQLARMVPEVLMLYDDDIVEMVNMAGQLYCDEDIGKLKTDAIANMIARYTSLFNVYAVPEKFTANSTAGDIMICGFDNMEARQTFFNSWKAHVDSLPEEEKRNCLYIDGRLTMNELQVFCISGDDEYNAERYRNQFLFNSNEAEHTVCSMKQTTYLASMIGSFIVNLFTNWVANSLNPIIPYDVPFFTSYDAQNMLLNFER